MNGPELLQTALLLGLYVLLAGCYGLAYTIGRLRGAGGSSISLAAVAYALHAAVACFVVAWSPLSGAWKVMIVVSSLALLRIPPVTWRYLEHSHREEAET
jgi:hypothetical protein